MMKRALSIWAALSMGAVGCGDGQGSDQETGPAAEDFHALAEWVADEASFDEASRRAALARIEQLVAEGPAATEAGFWLQVSSVVGLADNGHSNLGLAPVFGFGLLPLQTYWFSDGLYVVRARSEEARLVGARVDSIGGRAVEELVALFDPYHGGTAENFRQYFSTPLLLAPAMLHAAGVSEDRRRAALSLTLSDGARARVVLEPDPELPTAGRVSPWVRLLAGPLRGEDGRWSSVFERGAEMPLALQDPQTPFRYVHMADRDVVYLQLRANIDQDGVSIRDWARETRDRLEVDRPRTVILDNRFNGGGDLTRTAELALDLPELVPEGGHVVVLTSNATFSAGIYTSFFPKATDPERTVVLGERVGDRERFWAESRGPFRLPASGYAIGQSLQLHDLGAGCPVRDLCHLAGRGRMDIAVGSLDPDVHVPWTYADYAAGRDPALERALREGGDRTSAM